jgi:hypothetical protein
MEKKNAQIPRLVMMSSAPDQALLHDSTIDGIGNEKLRHYDAEPIALVRSADAS